MSMEEFLSLIEKNFPHLFTEFGFIVSFKKEIRLDHNSIGLESDSLKILFEQERGGYGIFVGGLDSSFDDKRNGWVNLYSLMSYITKREIDWSILNKMSSVEKTNTIFSITAKEFALLYSQMVEMFRSPDIRKLWKPEYDQHLREKIARRFPKK